MQQGFLQQTLQNLAGQDITLPQIAIAAQQLQNLQESTQNVISNSAQQPSQTLKLSAQNLTNQNQAFSVDSMVLLKSNPINSILPNTSQFNQSNKTSSNQQYNSSPLSSSNHQNVNFAFSTSSVPVSQKFSPTVNVKEKTGEEALTKNKFLNSASSSSLTDNSEDNVSGQSNLFNIKNRSEPSPEEMTDLEELEQFAKMFKQRRIKLGK